MLKESIISLIIIALICFGNYKTNEYTKESITEIEQSLSDLRSQLIEQEDMNIKTQMESIDEKWKNRYTKLAYFIEHDELEKVEIRLKSLESYIETKEYNEAINELDEGEFILKHIQDKYAFNLENIF